MSKNLGIIQICGTTIGNLSDISKRVISALFAADVVYAEDTRIALKLLIALNLPKKPVKRLDDNKMKFVLKELKADIYNGKQVVYVSDAGMPGISDPGLEIVAFAKKENLPFEILPGPSASILAYIYSGFNTKDFYFAGFLPRKEQQINNIIHKLKNLHASLIFYESPKRIVKSLDIFDNNLPKRKLCLCRELTKLHEEIFYGTAQEIKVNLLKKFGSSAQVKGEICLVVDAAKIDCNYISNQHLDIAKRFLKDIKDTGLSNKDKAMLLVKYFSINKNAAYSLVLENAKINA